MNRSEFRKELLKQLARAEGRGDPHVEITSGNLHRQVGGYPGDTNHRMPTCCDVMYAEMGDGDRVISAPAKGKGARVTIRYRLPRNS